MVAHRKNVPSPRGYVPSSGFIVLTVMVIIGTAGWLGWLLLDDDSSTADTASPSVTATATSEPPAVAEEPSTTLPNDEQPEAGAEPEVEPEPEETTESPVPVVREAPVAVLNNSGITGAARTFSATVAGAGWRLDGVGNWRGSIPANTVYYPAGLQGQAELLAKDVAIDRILPSVSPMRTDRLTIILSGPQ